MAVGRYLAPRPDDEDFRQIGIVRRVVREFGLVVVVAGLILLLFVGYQLLGTNLTEQHKQNHLEQAFNRAVALNAAALPTTTVPATTVPTAVPTTVPAAAATTIPGTPPTTVSATTTPPTTAVNANGSDNPTLGTPSNASVPPGGAIDHLVIPAIGVDKYVVQGVSQSDLTAGPGHYPETVLPGQVGNAAIAGHRTTYGAPFFRLNSLKSGDRIIITDTSDHRFTYRVKSVKVVAPTDDAVLNPTKTPVLTLTTCNPRFSLKNRLIVVAQLSLPKPQPTKGSTTPTTTLVPAPLPPAANLATANLGRGDPNARTPALFYGGLVVLLWLVTRIAVLHTHRWRRSLVYLIGIAACLVALWFTFENVVKLLPPNL